MAKHGQGADSGEDTETDTDGALQDGVGKFFDKTVARKSGAPSDDDAEDDADSDDADADDDDDADADEGDDSDADDGEEDEDGDGEDDADADDDEDGEDDDADEDDDEETLDPSFLEAAAKHKLPTRFDDIVRTLPKAAQAKARLAFGTRLKEMESGLNRAFQEARGGRKTLATLTAEKTWIEKNPIDYFLDVMAKDPKFVTALNEELEKHETPAYAEARTMRRQDTKKKEIDDKAKEEEDKIEREAKEHARRAERAGHVGTLAKRLAKQEGVPYSIVEKALYIAITTSADGDITDAQVKRIVAQEAKELRRHTGERRRDDRKTYVRDKVAGSKAAKKRPTSRDRGHSPAPGRVRPPKSLEEALTRSAARIFPDAPSGR